MGSIKNAITQTTITLIGIPLATDINIAGSIEINKKK